MVAGISCRYNDHRVVEDFSFSLAAGDISCLLGPSGCGKTTVLRAIAGFQPLSAGTIALVELPHLDRRYPHEPANRFAADLIGAGFSCPARQFQPPRF